MRTGNVRVDLGGVAGSGELRSIGSGVHLRRRHGCSTTVMCVHTGLRRDESTSRIGGASRSGLLTEEWRWVSFGTGEEGGRLTATRYVLPADSSCRLHN